MSKRSCSILDNFEHVVEAAPLVSELLTRCPQLTCLVTSRALLRLSGEHAFPVPPLPLPPAVPAETAAEACLSPAIQLFVSRAQEVRPDFELTDANAGAIAAICRRLDGLPLAIELAAARVRHLTAVELAARLLDGKEGAALGVLTGGPRDAQAGSRRCVTPSPGATISSHPRNGRCSAVWRSSSGASRSRRSKLSAISYQLSAFTHHPSPHHPFVIDSVAALVDQSLLQTAEEAPDGLSRYEMLETVREYALEQLAASGEEAEVGTRTPLTSLASPNGRPRCCRRNSNRPGWNASRSSKRTCASPWRGWSSTATVTRCGWPPRCGTSGTAVAPGRKAEAGWTGCWPTTSDGGDLTVQAMALTGAAWLAHYQNDYAAARPLRGKRSPVSAASTGRMASIEILHCQALVAQSLGENQRAADLSEEALALARALGDPGRTAESLGYLSRATRELGDYARAATLGQEALAIQQGSGTGAAWPPPCWCSAMWHATWGNRTR